MNAYVDGIGRIYKTVDDNEIVDTRSYLKSVPVNIIGEQCEFVLDGQIVRVYEVDLRGGHSGPSYLLAHDLTILD